MRKKAIKYHFKPEAIIWMQSIKKAGVISSDEVPNLQQIYRDSIDHNYTINCSTCSESVAAEYKRLMHIIEQSIEIPLMTWRKPAQEQKDADEWEDMTKNQIRQHILDKTNQDIGNIKGINRAKVIEKAQRVLNSYQEGNK